MACHIPRSEFTPMPVRCCATPGFGLRWWLRGWAGEAWCTTLIDLSDDKSRVWVHPAAVTTYSTLLDTTAVRALHDAVVARAPVAVTGRHPLRAKQKLSLAPIEPRVEVAWSDRPPDADYLGPMELRTSAPDGRLQIYYSKCRLLNLRDKLADILARMHE
jgi:hypothetical protein